jgi:SAM-dependent methyltransferase
VPSRTETEERQPAAVRTRPVILDLGCGQTKVHGAIGVDSRPLPGVVDICHDLTAYPYPFEDNSADEIYLRHVLEHLPDTLRIVEEVWRILKPGGFLHIHVPHFTGIYAWKDPTHVKCFTSESFEYFGENRYSYYTHARFAVVSTQLRYSMTDDARESGSVLRRGCAKFIQWMIDCHPTFAERHLAYLVGGIDELRCVLQASKATS